MRYWLPKGWQKTEPDPRVLDNYRPGDALAMVCGYGLDGLDTDPRSGGDKSRAALEADRAMPRVYGKAETPSGGTHELVATMGVRSRDKVRPGLDIKAGAPDGAGRGFLFIAPTRKRSKVDGTIGEYWWRERPNLAALAAEGPEDRSGKPLAEMVDAQRKPTTTTTRNTRVPPQVASDAEVAAFVAEYQRSERPEILQGWVKALTGHFAEGSRHDGAVSVVTGALQRGTCGLLFGPGGARHAATDVPYCSDAPSDR